MTGRVLQPASEISTHFRCDNCGILLDKVNWMQCKLCKAFDLCDDCAASPYDQLSRKTLSNHQKRHNNTPVTGDCLNLVSIKEAEINGNQARLNRRQKEYERIVDENTIENDYDMAVVMDKLVHDLNNSKDTELFLNAQKKFTENFDYFVGTSAGGLIAFCLAINYNILNMKEIYSNSKKYFKKNYLGPLIYSKYDPSVIHNKIDQIIDEIIFPDGRKISSKHATLLDLPNLLDPDHIIDDPEVAALWAIRMQWKKPANYHLLSVGTGCYTSTLSPSTWGGYLGWIFNQGFLVNTLMDATRSFTEIIGSNLAKFNNMRRMKLNYQITKPMALDDPDFVRVFDQEWEKYLKHEDDFEALIYFYNRYITNKV